MYNQDVKRIRGLPQPVAMNDALVAALKAVAPGSLKMSNINSWYAGSMSYTDGTNVFACGLPFAGRPTDTDPGTDIEPENVAGRCNVTNVYPAEVLRMSYSPAALYFLLALRNENAGFNTARDVVLNLVYGVITNDLRALYEPLREAYDLPLTNGGQQVYDQATANLDLVRVFAAVMTDDTAFNFGVLSNITLRDAVFGKAQSDQQQHGVRFIDFERMIPSLDQSALIQRRCALEHLVLTNPGQRYFHSFQNYKTDIVAAAALFSMNYQPVNEDDPHRDVDFGFVDEDALELSSPMQSLGFLQMEGLLSNAVCSNFKDFQRKSAIETAKKVNRDAYQAGKST